MRHLVVPELPVSGRFSADEDGSHHLLRVLRLERLATVQVSDGNGREGVARLVEVRGGTAILEVETVTEVAPPLERVVLLGMPKGPLLEEALTLGTEAGATEFRLISARFSQPWPAKMERLERVMRFAATQCRRSHLPRLRGPLSLTESLSELPATRWLGTQGAVTLAGPSAPAALAIGPEGGWSQEETAILKDHGFVEVGLGPFVLRNPTAVAVGLGRLFPG